MKKIFNILKILLLNFVIITTSFAGNYMESGTTLTENSYVFNIEEANDLMNRLYYLEQENENQKKLLEEYKKLDQTQINNNDNLSELIKIKELQLSEYKEIHQIDVNRIKQLSRQKDSSVIKDLAFLGLGFSIGLGSILIADKVDDNIEYSKNNNLQRDVGLTLVRF